VIERGEHRGHQRFLLPVPPHRNKEGEYSLFDVVGADLSLEAQQLQDKLADPTRLLPLLSLHGFVLVSLGHMNREVVTLRISLHSSEL
jgi:hypothetical protein